MLLIDFDRFGTLSCGTVGQYCSAIFFRYYYFIGICFLGLRLVFIDLIGLISKLYFYSAKIKLQASGENADLQNL